MNLENWFVKLPKRLAFAALMAAMALALGACGPDSSSPAPAAASSPFNVAKGEGKLVSSELVTTYPTASANNVTGLDAFYNNLICSGLNQTDCATNIANLNTPEFGNFDLASDPIANNPLGIANVDAVKIDYGAINVDHAAVTVSGGIAIPELSPDQLKGVILYFHGTTVQRTNVPSNFTATTNVSSYTDGVLLAALWASQGYVVVMPDYIGLGDDVTHVHPYVVYPRENAQCGLAMLKAARTYLAQNYQVMGRLPLFITGYSEGGAYALEAARLMQSNPAYGLTLGLSLREDAPMSGFFDLSGTGLPYLFDNISTTNNNWYSLNPTVSAISKPYLSAYLVLSFANYSGIAPTDILAANFYNCPSNSPCGPSNNLDGLYFTAPQSSGYDSQVAFLTFALAQQTGWSITNNAVTPLLTDTYAQQLMQRDRTNPLYSQLVRADTYKFVPQFLLDLVSLEQDSVVTRKNSDVAYAYFIKQRPHGPYAETLVPNDDFLAAPLGSAGPIDHTTELPFLTVLVLNDFNTVP
jgi:hypothetical protein